VSFRPPFYSCQSCLPEEISDQFTKRYSAWYDDDYISRQGKKQSYNDDGAGGQKYNVNSTATNSTDDGGYYQSNDDIYGGNKYNNDDNTDDGNQSNHYVNTDDGVYYNYRSHDDDFYAIDDDNRRLRQWVEVDASHSITAKETLVVSEESDSQFESEFLLNLVADNILLRRSPIYLLRRNMQLTFKRRWVSFTASSRMQTMEETSPPGICATESITTACGATRTAVPSILSALTNGLAQISFFSSS
jgi:hypothetical protein